MLSDKIMPMIPFASLCHVPRMMSDPVLWGKMLIQIIDAVSVLFQKYLLARRLFLLLDQVQYNDG